MQMIIRLLELINTIIVNNNSNSNDNNIVILLIMTEWLKLQW